MSPSRGTYLLVLGGAALWCALIVGAPLLAGSPSVPGWVSDAIYRFFSPVCHQIAVRSIDIGPLPMAVCMRCSAIYFGFLAGTVMYPLLRSIEHPVLPSRWFVGLLVLPMVADVAFSLTPVHVSSAWTKIATGGAFGAGIPFVILPAACRAAEEWLSRPASTTTQKGAHHA